MYKKIYGLLFLSCVTFCYSLPLSTRSRWIIDEVSGARVKLACVNWVAHLEPMVPEGLDKRPVGEIVRQVRHMGFNCVRFTWATYMFTRFSNMTVAQSFSKLGLWDAMEGIVRYNPRYLNQMVVDVHQRVVNEIAREGLMVVLDNHVSRPTWCCSDHDGNGFFGDKYFDPKEWLQGLSIVAKRFNYNPMVVGMSMRNELRGPLQDDKTWYQYVKKGAQTIHRANTRVLVIVSGLHYDLNFEYLKDKSLNLNLTNKIVYEVHRYAFTSGQTKMWLNQPFTRACDSVTSGIRNQAGFLMEGPNAAPLFVSEFGVQQSELGQAESSFLGCFLGFLAEMDLDWSLWALQGSYYIRSGAIGPEETYGLLSYDWTTVRNPDFVRKLHLIQNKIQDPRSRGPQYEILYHPWSGQCVTAYGLQIHVTDCLSYSRWIFQGNRNGNGNPVRLMGTGLCLTASGRHGNPVTLTVDCVSRHSRWDLVAGSNYQVANRNDRGRFLCLEWSQDYQSRVFTDNCMCLEEDDNSMGCQESIQTQWFKVIPANAN